MQDENIEKVDGVVENNQQEDMEFTKEQFDVTSEVVEDFDYFYTDEDKILVAEKLKRKHRLFIGLIIGLLVFITIMAVGGTRMVLYDTNDVVTRELVQRKDYHSLVESPYKYVLELFTYSGNEEITSIDDILQNKINASGYLLEINLSKNSNKDKCLEYQTKLDGYVSSSSSYSNIPLKKGDKNYEEYKMFAQTLNLCLELEKEWVDVYISYYENEIDSDGVGLTVANCEYELAQHINILASCYQNAVQVK